MRGYCIVVKINIRVVKITHNHQSHIAITVNY